MLRIGKNAKDQEENDHSNHKPEVPDYAAKSYTSYQATNVEAKPVAEPAAVAGSRNRAQAAGSSSQPVAGSR